MTLKNSSFLRPSFLIGLTLLIFGLLAETAAILYLNSGFFVYSMDDPYIHLALSENIAGGNYGINSNENSSPSSSIIWPLLLVPFINSSIATLMPLLINIICSVMAYLFFYKIFQLILSSEEQISTKKEKVIGFLMVALLPVTNLISLPFIGMEHSMQVLVSIMIIYGMIYEVTHQRLLPWLLAVIILAPLVRYECFAISIPAIIFLFFRKYYVQSLICAVGIFLTVGGFTLFLLNIGQEPLPSSVLAKLANAEFASSGISIKGFVMKLFDKLNSSGGALLIISILLLGYQGLFGSNKTQPERVFALSVSIALVLHLLFGQFGFLGRYDTYIWVVSLFSLIIIYKDVLISLVSRHTPVMVGIIVLVSLTPLTLQYLKAILLTPIAANNIYEQHYQMHRFVVDFYGESVAVNDLGYVSYQNDQYVLDLWGLGSNEALNNRKFNTNFDWIDGLTRKKGVKFALIYDFWFKKVPDHWIKVGELHLGKLKVSPGESVVSFYALDKETYEEVMEYIDAYEQSLPKGVKFIKP